MDSCFKLPAQTIVHALLLAWLRTGKSSAARMAMMAITTRSSISVNAPKTWITVPPELPTGARCFHLITALQPPSKKKSTIMRVLRRKQKIMGRKKRAFIRNFAESGRREIVLTHSAAELFSRPLFFVTQTRHSCLRVHGTFQSRVPSGEKTAWARRRRLRDARKDLVLWQS